MCSKKSDKYVPKNLEIRLFKCERDLEKILVEVDTWNQQRQNLLDRFYRILREYSLLRKYLEG